MISLLKKHAQCMLAFTVMFSAARVEASTAQTKNLTELTVAQDGTGDYKTIQEAVNAVRDFSQQQVTIHIRRGIYPEKIVIPAWKTHVFLLGDDTANTIITNADYSGKSLPSNAETPGKYSTFNSYTLQVKGNDFRAEKLTIENKAGRVGQAVALHAEADRCVFNDCRITGNQDTLFAATTNSRQLYQNCYIEGTTDFIFGDATAVFQNCVIKSLANSYIIAASTAANQPYGFVFINCKLTAGAGVQKVFLGKPWRPYAKVVFYKCELGSHIAPQGWHNWNNPANESTAFYAEFQNTGSGADASQRVSWARQLSPDEMKDILLHIFNKKDNWDPEAK
ncbi:MAG TPA: pectinesterase family protein [Mucilaginibacter sp.]|jgi:pectinesterase